MKRTRQQQPMTEARTAAVYLRVSTADQANEGVSLDAQDERTRAYCQMHGLELVRVFRDPAVSGGTPLAEREQGRALLEAIARGEVRHVVALKLDRLFRNAIDCLQTAQHWDRIGVAMHLIDMGGQAVNTASAMGRFFLTVMAGAAEMERNLIGERTSTALQHKRRRGERLGTTPLGFSTPAPGEAMQPHAEELRTVRVILRARKSGKSYRAIAARLTRDGHQTKRGRAWGAETVRKVWQRREQYRGVLQ